MGRKAKPSGEGILSLARFLSTYMLPQWRLLLLALVATAFYAGTNALRAPLIGLFSDKVVFREQSERDLKGLRDENATLRQQISDAGLEAEIPTEVDAPAPTESGAGALPTEADVKAKAKGLVAKHLPFVERWQQAWERKSASFTWADWSTFCAGMLAILALFMGISNVLRTVLQRMVVIRALIAVRLHVSEHLLGLSLRFFSRQRLGDLYSRLTNDIGSLHAALGLVFVDMFEAILMIFAYSATALWASWKLAMVAGVFAPPIFLVMQRFGKKIRRRARGRQESVGAVTEEMQQMLSGIRIVKAFDNEKMQIDRFRDANEDYFHRAIKVIKTKAISRGVVEAMNHWILAAIIVVGLYYVLERGFVTMERLIVFIGSIALMYPPAKKLTKAYNELQDALAAVDRVRELLDTEPEVKDAPNAIELKTVKGDLAIKGLHFAYEDAPVLTDVSLEAKCGEVVALVGESGAGKSTLVDLLARFYDPDQGTIEIDGHPLTEVTRRSYMRHVAMVTQDPFLFNDTVRVNLRYARPEATDTEMIDACKAANIHDAITQLPGGYDTVLGERGVMLSGGQRQRLTIARALLKNPKILLLDEATSALDSESERQVQEALDRLMDGRTTVVVAHRLSTIMNASRIVVLDQGRVVEVGDHQELLAEGGRYAHFFRLQTDQSARLGASAKAKAGARAVADADADATAKGAPAA